MKRLRNALAFVERRAKCAELRPPCPTCKERDQLQLIQWMDNPVTFRCRLCKTEFQKDIPE